MIDAADVVDFFSSRRFEVFGLPWVAALVTMCVKVLRKPQPHQALKLEDCDVGFDMLIGAIFTVIALVVTLANQMVKAINATEAQLTSMRTQMMEALKLGVGWMVATLVLAVVVSEYGWRSSNQLNLAGILGPFLASVLAFLMFAYSVGG